MILNTIKTWIVMGTLAGLLVLAGSIMGGQSGATIALIFAFVMNFALYFFSDTLVLKAYKAIPLDEKEYAWVHTIVDELSHKAGIPKPKLWLLPDSMANAFATGRNPANSSVAVTEGILEVLDKSELRGVLAHELSHVKNRDILVGTIAATLVAAITYMADMLRWSMFWGNSDRRGGANIIVTIAMIILVPFAAMLLQLSISRTRELLADETGAKISQSPMALASALEKIHNCAQTHGKKATRFSEEATASLFICSPFKSEKSSFFLNLLSTHPPMEKRVEALRKMFERQ